MRDIQHEEGYAWTWEPAAAVALLVVVSAWLSVQTGRSVALFLTGQGWWWPSDQATISSTWGVIAGDVYAGLQLSGESGPILAWILALVMLANLGYAIGFITVRIVATQKDKGWASRAHAEELLGITRLRKTRKIIRPDLYNKKVRSP